MTHTWSVEKVRYEQSTGRITHLHWRLNSTDGTNNVNRYGSVYLPDDQTIPFASVTQTILKNWLEDRMTATTSQDEFETGVAAELTRMATPVHIVAEAPV